MSILLVKGNKFKYNNKTYELDDMFDSELFQKCDEIADSYDEDIDIVNEVFLSMVQPFKAIELFLSKFDIRSIEFENADRTLVPLVADYAKKNNIEVKGINRFSRLTNKWKGYLNIVLSSTYLFLKMLLIPHESNIRSNKNKLSLIRTPASKKKLSFLKGVELYYEDFNDKKSVYNCFRKTVRIFWVFKSWIESYKKIGKYYNYIEATIGNHSSYYAYHYYSKRVVHTLLYSYIIENMFIKNSDKTFYTGNNLDRFALIEEKMAKKYNLEIICIPHGLEYGFKFPHCFIGDKFYTTSYNASQHLNDLYKTEKFIFDKDIAYNMFWVDYTKENSKKNIVFFTEPREIKVNHEIIEEMIPFFKSKEFLLFVKLHPKDKKSNYKKYESDIIFIENFKEAVTGNICISRKSTILLEAIYNDSNAAAILINSKDKNIFSKFPSLHDEKIEKFYSFVELFKWIINKSK